MAVQNPPQLPPGFTQREDGFIELIPGALMRRLVVADKQFSEIRFEDMDIFKSLKEVMEILVSDDFLKDEAKPVVGKVVDQINDPARKRSDGAQHLMLEVDESIIFFNILVELDKLEKMAKDQMEKGGSSPNASSLNGAAHDEDDDEDILTRR